MESGSSAPNQKNLCQPLVEEYLAFNEHRRTKMVNSKNRHEIEDFINWGSIKTFDQITEKKFNEYINHKVNDEKLKPLSLNRYIASVKSWLNYCLRMRCIFFNPLIYVENLVKYNEKTNPKRFLNKKEIEVFIKTSKMPSLYVDRNPTLYPFIVTGIYSGMRPGELINLEWPDLDFKRRKIMIKSKAHFTTKNKEFREMPLFSRLHTILKPLRKKKGQCFDTTNLRRIFGRIIKKSKLTNVNLYTLRHTFISHALMDGTPIRTVAAWVGHSNIKTTMGYAHLLPEHSHKQIEKIKF